MLTNCINNVSASDCKMLFIKPFPLPFFPLPFPFCLFLQRTKQPTKSTSARQHRLGSVSTTQTSIRCRSSCTTMHLVTGHCASSTSMDRVITTTAVSKMDTRRLSLRDDASRHRRRLEGQHSSKQLTWTSTTTSLIASSTTSYLARSTTDDPTTSLPTVGHPQTRHETPTRHETTYFAQSTPWPRPQRSLWCFAVFKAMNFSAPSIPDVNPTRNNMKKHHKIRSKPNMKPQTQRETTASRSFIRLRPQVPPP